MRFPPTTWETTSKSHVPWLFYDTGPRTSTNSTSRHILVFFFSLSLSHTHTHTHTSSSPIHSFINSLLQSFINSFLRSFLPPILYSSSRPPPFHATFSSAGSSHVFRRPASTSTTGDWRRRRLLFNICYYISISISTCIHILKYVHLIAIIHGVSTEWGVSMYVFIYVREGSGGHCMVDAIYSQTPSYRLERSCPTVVGSFHKGALAVTMMVSREEHKE